MLAPFMGKTAKSDTSVVLSGSRTGAVIRAALSDAAEMLGTTFSGATEDVLLDALLPMNPLARRVAEGVYLGELSVRDAVANEFASDAAVVDWSARADGWTEQELCDFASSFASGAMIDVDMPDGMGGKIVFHARSCWDAAVCILRDRAGTCGGLEKRVLERDVAEAERLLEALVEGAPPVESARFYRVACRRWSDLRTSSNVYRALMDVTKMSAEWREDARLRSVFVTILDSVYGGRES